MINGVAASWSNMSVSFLGYTPISFSEISFSETQEIDPIYGRGVAVIGAGEGQFKYENGSITLRDEELRVIQNAVATGRIQDIDFFTITLAFCTLDIAKVHKYKLYNCRFLSNGRSVKLNDKLIEHQVPFFFTQVDWGNI